MSNRPYNYNIALMKCGLSYLVVLCHYWNPSKESRLFTTLGTLRSVAVPIFFIISFFLTAKIYEEIEHKKLGQRLHRLALPYFIWGGYIMRLTRCSIELSIYRYRLLLRICGIRYRLVRTDFYARRCGHSLI